MASEGGKKNDWKKYYSKSNQCWCWESISRKVRYLSASRSQKAVFEAGWVLLPPPSSSSSDQQQGKSQYYNVFSHQTVYDRSDIPQFVDNNNNNNSNTANGAEANRKRPHPPDDTNSEAKEEIQQQQQQQQNEDDEDDDQKKAAAHYNKLQRKREDRGKGTLAKMRAMNNWVKTVLIDSFIAINNNNKRKEGIRSNNNNNANTIRILELACGKGGDYFKIRGACPSNSHLDYVGIDIAQLSLEEFVRRVQQESNNKNRNNNNNKRRRPVGASSATVRLACANLGTDCLTEPQKSCWDSSDEIWTKNKIPAFPSNAEFDLVSMQFALHYMCQSSGRLSRFFQSWKLKDKGYFVATTMDPNVVRQYMQKEDATSSSTGNQVSPQTQITIQDQRNRTCCRMVFNQQSKAAILKDGWDRTLGTKYDMTLTEYNGDDDREGYNFVEAPEWVVPMAALIHHAWKYGNLYLVHQESCNFSNFFQRKRPIAKYQELLFRMKVLNHPKDDLSHIEWTLAKLYKTLVFQKGVGRRVAIVVPFRDEFPEQQRSKHLSRFAPYMIRYMSKLNVPFHIFIIEQSKDGRKFNRGKLLNAGYRIARDRGCSAFIFHDVDLLPDDNLMDSYRCDGAQFETVPNHIARVWDRYSGNKDYIGGVTAFSPSCFERLNGFPNNFWGWGGEDDELRNRLSAVKQSFSAPTSGSLTDLENMTIKEKMALLRKQNTDSEGSDNTWKCMIKKEVLKEHAKTWRNNGLFFSTRAEAGGGGSQKRQQTKLFSRSKEDLHPSGFASKITVELTKNNDKWDTVTSWKDL